MRICDRIKSYEIYCKRNIIPVWVKSTEFTSYKSNIGTYCVRCKENTANKISSLRNINQNTLMVVSNCVVCRKQIFEVH